MKTDQKQAAVMAVVQLETKMRVGHGHDGGCSMTPADCAEARRAVEAVAALLPTIIHSTLIHRIERAEQWLAQQGG